MLADDARDMLCAVAGPRQWHDTRQAWIARGAKLCGFSFRKARSIFYRETTHITAQEWIRLNDEFSALKKSAAERQELLRDVDLLAGANSAARGEDPRPLGVERGEASGARLGKHDATGRRFIR